MKLLGLTAGCRLTQDICFLVAPHLFLSLSGNSTTSPFGGIGLKAVGREVAWLSETELTRALRPPHLLKRSAHEPVAVWLLLGLFLAVFRHARGSVQTP